MSRYVVAKRGPFDQVSYIGYFYSGSYAWVRFKINARRFQHDWEAAAVALEHDGYVLEVQG